MISFNFSDCIFKELSCSHIYTLVGLDVTKERGRSGGSLGVWGAARTENPPHFHSSVLTLHSSSWVIVILQYGGGSGDDVVNPEQEARNN